MAGGSFLKGAYFFIGGTFSICYMVVGLMLTSGRFTLGMEPSMRILVGAVLLAYGIFRAYMFYKKYKEFRREDNG